MINAPKRTAPKTKPETKHCKIKSVNPPPDGHRSRENIPLTRFDFPIYLSEC